MLHTIGKPVARRLERGGFLVRDPAHDYLDFEPREALDQLIGASIHYRIAIGPNAGKKALTLRTVPARPEPFASTLLATQPGFSLHAVTRCEANQRDQLEKLCRTITRPAIANERLSMNERGQVIVRFKQPFRDGTTHVVLDPLDLMAHMHVRHPAGDLRSSKSAILPICYRPPRQLVPRPRLNLTRFHERVCPELQTPTTNRAEARTRTGKARPVGCEFLFKPPLVVEISRDSEISSGSHRGKLLTGLRDWILYRALVA